MITFGEVVTLQETIQTIQWTVFALQLEGKNIMQQITNIEDMYKKQEMTSQIKDGNVPYSSDSEGNTHGIGLEFRCV